MIFLVKVIILFILTIPSQATASGAIEFNPSDQVIGYISTYRIKSGDTLIKLARRFDLGYNEIIAANSKVDPWVPSEDSLIIIPNFWIIPEFINEGIVINLSELRLYFFFSVQNKTYMMTFPVGIGRGGYNTPEGIFRIISKVKDPVWKIPEDIRERRPELPKFVPPGPDNPLGKYWIGITGGYGIHGTNKPYGIGRRVSHGCIRLYPEDIEILFHYVRVGMKVLIINRPVKVGLKGNDVYIEIHPHAIKPEDLYTIAMDELKRQSLLSIINTQKLSLALIRSSGIPERISD